ncbi:MAG: molecular chaperone HtpG [Verrucomicrobia bacterium]|jgi:molecular chaperone HtpG|nr:molecular chaperone HtpG [Verrucomicrobiota bacterium]
MATRKLKFKTELNQLMDIIVHSLYSHKEIFLRELISNACDAIDKIRFESLTDASLAGDDVAYSIRIVPDSEKGTLTISDNGIGMTEETVIRELGTIARSGTKAFIENVKQQEGKLSPDLIGQFGVGFYSAFMVADKVTVVSRAAGSEGSVCWESTGQGAFTIKDAERGGRGTDVILHMREDAKTYLEGWEISSLVKRFSDFVEHPIVLVTQEEKDGETSTKEETVNSQKAIWLRSKSDVSDDEYASFYKHLTHDYADPLHTIHYSAEGTLEFKAILYIPENRPMDYYMVEPKPQLHLYVNRVFITDACEHLLPMYLRFVKGVVDSSDLPLNVSREMLQDNPLLRKIQTNLVTRILGALDELKTKDYEKYCKFFAAFGSTLKEGVTRDLANREKVADLALFQSTRTEPSKFLSLGDYVDQMSEGQDTIYYLSGDNADMLRHSPYLEAFRERGQDVLLMDEPVDPFFADALGTYKGKTLKAVDKGELEEEEENEAISEETQTAYEGMLGKLSEALEEVKSVRLSRRLTESAACLVAEEGEMNAQMERLMAQFGGPNGAPATPRILELNPEHDAVKALLALYDEDSASEDVTEFGRLFLDQAIIAEGSRIKDPAAFSRRVNMLIARMQPGS